MSQCDLILTRLKRGGGLTAKQAASFLNCWRLAARIAELRERGHDISTQIVDNGNGVRYARYWLKERSNVQ
jgi:hypothetical protein